MKLKSSPRALKKQVLDLLNQEQFEKSLIAFRDFPARKVVNPIISFFYDSKSPLLKWRAVSAMGEVMFYLANDNMESARVIMRRLMWNLNEESGGIGWGSPEAMGEIMARQESLAKEYYRILLSYIVEEKGNYLEHELLQRGVLWGIGRLAHARPQIMYGCTNALIPFLKSEDPNLRGLAAWAAGSLELDETRSLLTDLLTDQASIEIYIPFDLKTLKICELVKAAMPAD
jgi:hypothetical protein